MKKLVAPAAWWFASLGIIELLWESLARTGVLNTYILPPPSMFLGQLIHLSSFGFGENPARPLALVASMVLSSSSRVLSGMLLGLVCALPCGLLMGRVAWLEKLLSPMFILLAPLAPLAWIPLILVLIGVGNGAAVTVVFVGVFFLLTLATLNAVKNVDGKYLQLAEYLGAGKLAQIIHVVIPASLPTIFVILRINFFAAWMAVLTAEGIGITTGLGALVIMSRATANVRLMLASMFLIALSGTLIDLLLRRLQSRLFGWYSETLLGI